MKRAVARVVHAPEGDFRDWDAIDGYGPETITIEDPPAGETLLAPVPTDPVRARAAGRGMRPTAHRVAPSRAVR